ncbi:hypothetical protein IAG44_34000 [Streptomyces roseirectus]|uniref:DUF8017 domain-containing protein n=1 Tax=Streptomyces roseirectus TaxID=2768066 RepID=A0A7H0IMG5_9ACTN|nr:hypothetical protein [Streptomyces roseirectus]QNP73981.1 hypothetical protein IAG44_34000 [Streptomyces roseirectus]
MWQGQQPPGGQQHPRGQDNPYQQPGYHQPNPYRQPEPQPAPQPAKPRRTRALALTVAAVVVACAVTGALLLRNSSSNGDDDPTTTAAASTSPDPRQPTVAGWKTVVNPSIGVAFDVPATWAPQKTSWITWVSENDDPQDKPLAAVKAPAYLERQWCTSDDDRDGRTDDTALAMAGTRGEPTAKSAEAAARKDAETWVYGDFTQPDHDKVTTEAATPFTSASGLTGSVVTARSHGVDKPGKCDYDGKATTFAFRLPGGTLASWTFVGVRDVRDEVPDATVRRIMTTVRAYEPSES